MFTSVTLLKTMKNWSKGKTIQRFPVAAGEVQEPLWRVIREKLGDKWVNYQYSGVPDRQKHTHALIHRRLKHVLQCKLALNVYMVCITFLRNCFLFGPVV